MEALMNAMLAGMQMPAAAPTAKKGASGQKDGFQELLEQKQNTGASSAPKQEKPETPQEPQDAQNPQETPKTQEGEAAQPPVAATESGKVLEEQMALAAMLMMQSPLTQEIAQETPQVLTDPNWQEGLVPVDFMDSGETGLRIVSWMPKDAAPAEELDAVNTQVAEWMQQSGIPTETEALPEELPQAAEVLPEMVTPAAEVKTKIDGVSPQEGDGEEEVLLSDAEMESPVFEDVKAVPVKVGEAPKAEVPEQSVEKQIIPKLTEALENGQTRVELQLTPENLGKVQVEMTWSQDGSLHVEIHAATSRAENLLEKNLDSLQAMLAKGGQQEVRVEVQRQQESQQQNLYDQQRQGGQQGRQQEQRQNHSQQSGEDFLNQLRLGLVPMDGELS